MGKVTGRPTGVRLTKRQTENCRAEIQATSLINRLQDNANGKLRDKSGNFIEMTNGQVRSADILLNKALPNLQATELLQEKVSGLFLTGERSVDPVDKGVRFVFLANNVDGSINLTPFLLPEPLQERA